MKNLFKSLILDFQQSLPFPNVRSRDIEIPLNSGKIISVIGPRRSGKTYLFYYLINRLIETVPKQHIVYINFEDERLDVQTEHLQFLLEAYLELFPQTKTQNIYFFFDEIQNVANWEKFIRRVYDTFSKNIFITGSSSRMLGYEIASSLRGRHLVYSLLPLSFKEFCRFNNADFRDTSSTRNRALLLNLFEQYLYQGGFPELLYLPPELKVKTLQSYFDVMIFRDIVERYQVNQVVALKYFIKKLFESIASEFSINKIFNELKSMGLKTAREKLYAFLDYVTDTFLFFVVFPYQKSLVKSQMSNKKIYAVDSGLIKAITFKFSHDFGKLLENVVFLHLLRQEKEVFFHRNHFETDFIVLDSHSPITAIQVSYSLSAPETRQREFKSLLKTLNALNLKSGKIITFDTKEIVSIKDRTIEIVPAWEYLLSKEV